MDFAATGGNFQDMRSELADQEADILKFDDVLDVKYADQTIGSIEGEYINTLLPYDPDANDETELSPDGVLDEETIARGMSNLGCCASGCHQVFLDVTIPGFSLTDISLLSEYAFLQKVELPYNDITDLSPLGKLKHMIFLDASHNKIEKLLDFEPPFNLQEVDLSWNNIQEMSDLSAHHFLKTLVLDNNSISSIHGLQKCKRLKYLSLSHNNIIDVTGLDGLMIQHLNISNNMIKLLQNLESLACLKSLNLSGNCIRGLSGLSSNTKLETVDLEANEVLDVMEIERFKLAQNLQNLNLLRNPIQELPDYRLCILFRLSRLTVLDRHPVKEEEKTAALNMFDPPKDVVAARDHIKHVVYAFLQPARVQDSTLPNIGTPYPMLVLVGPQGAGKKELTTNLLQEFPDYFGHGISHTTRRPRLEEVTGSDYCFVSLQTFEEDIKKGQFIQTVEYNNNWFGLKMSSVENVAKEGLACVTHMEFEGVLSLKRTFFEPRYVLILPLNSYIHEKRLNDAHIYTQAQIDTVLKRAEMYTQHSQNHPGFFDMMINSDNIAKAYEQLRKLVMGYLGIGSNEAGGNMLDTEENETADSKRICTRQALSNLMRSGSWTRLSVTDNESRYRSSRMASVAHGVVEEESIKRRHTRVKELVSGYIPTFIEQVSSSYPRAASLTTDHNSFAEADDLRPHSAPTNQMVTHVLTDHLGSEDSSNDTRSVSNETSYFDSAKKVHKDRGRTVDKNFNFMGALPTEKVNPLDLINERSYQTTSKIDLPEADPLSALHTDPKYAMARPRSSKHAVLPPIPNTSA